VRDWVKRRKSAADSGSRADGFGEPDSAERFGVNMSKMFTSTMRILTRNRTASFIVYTREAAGWPITNHARPE
jgi:hypothetical protein